MKYGDTFQQRSIPLWETYNVDYNDIKRLIKLRTTHFQGQAKTIPTSNNGAKHSQAFEAELYQELREQHQRVDLFVQSKAGEIARRLAHLDKQIAQLGLRTFANGQTKISIKRLEKFSKAETAVLRVGEDIQSLSRFVGAQHLAFQKLLKKYKKWTGSTGLGHRFREEILGRPTSFSKRDFQPLLVQWTEILARVRAPFMNGVDWSPDSHSAIRKASSSSHSNHNAPLHPGPQDVMHNASSSAAALHSSWESGSSLDQDSALMVTPLGSGGIRAVYWVHPDNIVQIHVLLLQHTRLQRLNCSNEGAVTPSSSSSSRRSSLKPNGTVGYPPTDEDTGTIVCDNLQDFATRQSSETISAAEYRSGTVTQKAAVSIRYTRHGEAVVLLCSVPDEDKVPAERQEGQMWDKIRVESQDVPDLFARNEEHRCVTEKDSGQTMLVRKWLARHQEVQPLVQIQAKRTRFVGLRNSESQGVWVTLDKTISIRSCPSDSLSRCQALDDIEDSEKVRLDRFPHAILEVRLEGDAGKDLVNQLDSSHLTERVRGFSIETHAVATACKPEAMSHPFWLPALQCDIRKLPAANDKSKVRASQGRSSPDQPSTRHTSVSASSAMNGLSSGSFSAKKVESSATSAPDTVEPSTTKDSKRKKRRQLHRRRTLEKGLLNSTRNKQQHYWNEFDDGSEASGDEAYTILVDPNASYSLPGSSMVSKALASVSSRIRTALYKVSFWSKASQRPESDPEHEPLINGERSPSIKDSDLSDGEPSFQHPKRATQRHYSTFPPLSQSPAIRARETLLFRSCLASFGASVILLLVAAILSSTGRRKAETTVDAGVIIGVAASLVFAIIAVGSMLGRKDDVGWLHRSIVVLVWACVVVCGGALLASLR